MKKKLLIQKFEFLIFMGCCCLMSIINAHGQGNLQNFNNFKHVSTSDRFALNSVTAIKQDQQGFMWFGTRNGLVRYDGENLKFIKRDLSNKFLINFNDINGIEIDSQGHVWMGTSNGLSIYMPEKDSILNFPTIGVKNSFSSSNIITCVREMISGEIWIGTNNGLSIYKPAEQTFNHLFHDPNKKKSLSANDINCIYQQRDGTIWVGTGNGLNKFIGLEDNEINFKVYKHHSLEAGSIVNSEINVLLEDKTGKLWVGTPNGLDYLNIQNEEFFHFSKKEENRLTSEIIRALTIDGRGRLWVGTYDGINIIEDGIVIRHIKHDPEALSSLVDNKIRAMFTDKNGSVWVGSYYGGINYWDERQLNFYKIDEGNGHKLSFKVVSSIAQQKDGQIIFGTEGEGISVYNPKTNTYTYHNQINEDLKIGPTKTLFLDGSNDLWIGTFNSGLIYFNKDANDCKHFTHDPQDPKSLSSDKVLAIAQSSGEKLWIGTLAGGLNLFDPETETFTQIKSMPNDNFSIHSNAVRPLFLDKQKDLYVGTTLGLSVLRKSSLQEGFPLKFERLSAAADSLANMDIQDIFEDDEGQIWVGTLNFGFFKVIDNKLIPVRIKGVTSVYGIIQDENNDFWLSSKEGLVQYNPENHFTKIYDSKDGVQPNEFLRSSKLFSADGRAYFGGASGVTAFLPEAIVGTNSYAPDVIITGLKLYDYPLEVGDSTGILQQSIEYTNHLTLDYDQNIFTINFSMPNFIETENNVYHYRLKGLDKKWTTTTIPMVTYTIQRGGDYVFEVKGENGDGYLTSGVTSLDIEVFDPPWRTWWAYSIYGLIVFSSFFIFMYVYQSRIKLQHKLDLETREFLHQQEVNKQKLQFFTNISHEFRTPLTLISGPLQKLLADYKGPHKLFRQLLVIKKNTDQLFKLVNELLDFRKFENKQMKLQAAEGNIVKFTREIFLSFSQQAKFNKYAYTFESESEEMLLYFDRDKLEKVFYNLLANAFKYTPRKGSIAMCLKRSSTHVDISIKDSGEGIEAEQVEKIFDRFYEIAGQKNYGKFTHGSGLGLAIVKSVTDLHKGTVHVKSQEGSGSCFTVSLPLGRGHLLEDEIIKEFRDSEDVRQYIGEPLLDIEPAQNISILAGGDVDQKCVLVVEDNPDVGHFIKDVLSDLYKVVLVENGVLGYQSAISVQPDLIISDLMMPEMDGLEFCGKIKTDIRTSHIPFILLSARTSLVYKYDGLESGADEYLYKPFELRELLLKCKNIIRTHDRLKDKFLNSGLLAPSEIAVNSLDETMMNKAFLIVKKNISNELFGVEQFSEELGISRSLLFTKFKGWTNQTPNEFILSMRMKQAANLIEQNKFNISEIGYKVGFKDPSYFSKIFKKHHQITPKAYSEKFRAGFFTE